MSAPDDDRLLESFARDFEPELAERADDAALIGRALDGALAATVTPERAVRRRWPWLLAAAALLVGAGAAAKLFRAERQPEIAPPPSASAPAPEPPAKPPELVPSAEPPSAPEADKPVPAPSALVPRSSAADLFARANQARRDKKDTEAIRLYRELQRSHPDSREARASRVMLGQLLLDRTDAKEAVGEFDSYLKGSPGAVTEEALVGRARALGKLGKKPEERAAWQELLRRYPASLHAAEAKARLGALAE